MKPMIDPETRRMELRGIVRVASEVIAQYWPMRTFVHHNPLHSLEYLPFDETVRRGETFLGGRGYLAGDLYRRYLSLGRIQLRHLDEALRSKVQAESVTIGPLRITHAETLRACLTDGLCRALEEPLDTVVDHGPTDELAHHLADHLSRVLRAPTIPEHIAAVVRDDQSALGRSLTLSTWCDRTLGTDIVARVNSELIKWCEAFLDEGHAAWPMPKRERGFYLAWKAVAAHEWAPAGIAKPMRSIADLPDHPEDAILGSLDILGIPEELRQDYLSLQLTALPGWAGFVKWRGEQRDYPWQQAHPVSLVKFLAVRLWYVCELVHHACGEALGIDGTFDAVSAFMRRRPHEYALRREGAAGRLPARFAEEVARCARKRRDQWHALAERLQIDTERQRDRSLQLAAGRRLIRLAQALEIVPTVLLSAAPDQLVTLIRWMDAFPESQHGPVWLRAFEAGYQDQLRALLRRTASPVGEQPAPAPSVRPQAQSVFCIDVRSEPFRRHLEATGDHDTYGFAGFFAVFIRYRAWGKEHYTEQYPVVMRARNEVREIPRSYFDHLVLKHRSRSKLLHAGHTLLHDLKENVVTPYVMVESLGWFYGWPIIGKTLLPSFYRRVSAGLRQLLVPAIATSMTVDKLSPADIDEMVVAEQRAVVWKALREELGLHGSGLSSGFVEALRVQAMNGEAGMDATLVAAADAVRLSKDELTAFVETLRRRYRITLRSASMQKERITRTGFTLEEQVLTLDTALRMMGLTRNFARVVLLCGHGSTSENNPFEAALDCGACGGNEGKPNARVLAAMANNAKVREGLAKTGIEIPADTHFVAGQMDTTTNDVQLFDLEEVPPTHRKDVARLVDNLKEAAQLTRQERYARFPEVPAEFPGRRVWTRVCERSADWSQVRPEWGLAGNAAFLIGRREITKGLNLAGRVFLHSYDYREDPSSRLLEVIMTGPQLVAQWINMEHYFSVVVNDVYGSGSKVYHNVVGRVGIMSGPYSDLRLGLARQTVLSGDMPYHEPMRMVTVIEAPRERIVELIGRHELLQHFYRNEWVHLMALDPHDGNLYRYQTTEAWTPVDGLPRDDSTRHGKEYVE